MFLAIILITFYTENTILYFLLVALCFSLAAFSTISIIGGLRKKEADFYEYFIQGSLLIILGSFFIIFEVGGVFYESFFFIFGIFLQSKDCYIKVNGRKIVSLGIS